MKDSIRRQIQQAFDQRPDVDGVIHGVREIVQGKHGSRSSLFYSAINGALIPVESRLEEAFCYRLESGRKAGRYRSQSLKIPFGHTYLYPDFLIFDSTNQPVIVEIKHSAYVNDEKNKRKAAYLRHTFEQMGVPFFVKTELDLGKPNELENLKMLYNRGGRISSDEYVLQCVVDLIRSLKAEECRFSAIHNLLKGRGFLPNWLEAAIFAGRLRCDLSRPINANTLVEVA